MIQQKEEIIKKLKEVALKGKISCTDAHKVAEEFGVDPAAIGNLCNELKLKIYGCELGLF